MVANAHDEYSISSGSSISFSDLPLGKIMISEDDSEHVIIGDKKYVKNDLMRAFGGTLEPAPRAYPSRSFANPVSLGLSAFSFTTFVLSMINARAQGVSVPNVVVAPACFYGGAIQLLAGVWCFLTGNTFGATALCSYGSFWLSYASIFVEAFGISAAYEDPGMLNNAVGFFLAGWAIVTFGLTLCTTKSTVAFFLLFFFLTITFILLSIGSFTGKVGVTRAGGVVGVITALVGWYNAFAGVATHHNSYMVVYPLSLPKLNLHF